MRRNINFFLYILLLFFVFFEGIRSNLTIGGYISPIRELCIVYLIFVTLLNKEYRCSTPMLLSLRLFLFYHIIISVISVLEKGSLSMMFIIKPLEFLGLIFVFYNFEELTGRSVNTMYKYIIIIAVFFCITNVVLYFSNLPIWVRPVLWWGRISCGYPTMDVVSLCYALCLLIFYPDFVFSPKSRVLFFFIIVIGVLLNFSGTGIILLSIIILTSCIAFKYVQNKKPLLASLVISLFLIISSFSYLISQFPEEFENGLTIIENKWNTIIGEDVDSDSNTLEVREEQYENVRKRLNSFTEVTGIGLVNMSMERDSDQEYVKDTTSYFIENQYKMLLMGYGYIGLFLYIFVFFELSIIIIRNRMQKALKIMCLLFVVIAACNSYTLILLMLFPNFSLYALAISLIVKMGDGHSVPYKLINNTIQ